MIIEFLSYLKVYLALLGKEIGIFNGKNVRGFMRFVGNQNPGPDPENPGRPVPPAITLIKNTAIAVIVTIGSILIMTSAYEFVSPVCIQERGLVPYIPIIVLALVLFKFRDDLVNLRWPGTTKLLAAGMGTHIFIWLATCAVF